MIALQKGVSDHNVGEKGLFTMPFVDAIPKLSPFPCVD
jgi:hypothetical protein